MTLEPGTRVELHPATDEWMSGDRFGVVVGLGRKVRFPGPDAGRLETIRPIKIKLDKSGRVRRFHPDNVREI